MKNIVDTVISINTDKLHEKRVISSFIYNRYKNNETTINDNIIKNNIKRNNNDIKNRFIRLSISRIPGLYDQDLDEYTLDIPELYNIGSFDNLDNSDLTFFNYQENYNHTRKYYITKETRKSIRETVNYFASGNTNINGLDIENIVTTCSKPNKTSVFNDDTLNINLLNENKFFNNSFFESELPEKVLQSSQKDNIKSGFIFNSFKFFKQQINEENVDKFAKKNGVRCGILVKKYKLVGDKYNKIAAKFYTKKRGENNLENLVSVIEDEFVQYGETYKYVICDVYLYAYPDTINRFALNYYLLCDNEYETEGIECREFVAPPPPVNLKFHYSEEKRKLKINWDEPTNYQYDAKGYQILKRNSLDEPFTIIAQLDGHSEFDDYRLDEVIDGELITRTEGPVYEYIDNSYEPGKITIYAIRTIDAHGFISDYSSQIGVLYDPFEEDLILDYVSPKGAERDFPNQKVKKNSIFFKNDINIIENVCIKKNPNRVTLYITPEIGGYKSTVSITNPIVDNEYQFTITKLNNMTIYKEKFSIINFNLS